MKYTWNVTNGMLFKKRNKDFGDKLVERLIYSTENLYGLKTDEIKIKPDGNGIYHIAY